MACVFRIKLCSQRPGDHFPTNGGLGTSISCYTTSTVPCDPQSMSHSSLTPPQSSESGQRVIRRSEDAKIGGRGDQSCAPSRLQRMLLSFQTRWKTRLSLVCRGKPQLFEGGSYQENRFHVCSFVLFLVFHDLIRL